MSPHGIYALAVMMLSPPPPGLQPIGRLADPALREASGIVASRRHPGVFWVHNDSGNPPALFAVRRDGSTIRSFPVAAPNVDWEDIAADDSGHLYLGEIGNNGGRLPLRAVYQLDEPDPSRPADSPLPVKKASFYTFPEGGRFDAEGLYVDRGEAIVVAKTFDGREAGLFALPLEPPAPLLRPAVPRRVGRLPGFAEPATAADLSRDGTHLAVASYRVTRIYGRGPGGSWMLLKALAYEAPGIEAVCWDGDDLILAGESRGLYRIPARAWRPPVARGRR